MVKQSAEVHGQSYRKDILWGATIALFGGLLVNLPNLWKETLKEKVEVNLAHEQQIIWLNQTKAEVQENLRKIDRLIALDPLSTLGEDYQSLQEDSLGRRRVEFNLYRFRTESWNHARSVKGILERDPTLWARAESFYTRLDNIERSLEVIISLWETSNKALRERDWPNPTKRAEELSSMLRCSYGRIVKELNSSRDEGEILSDSLESAIGLNGNVQLTLELTKNRLIYTRVKREMLIDSVVLIIRQVQFLPDSSAADMPDTLKGLGPFLATWRPGRQPSDVAYGTIPASAYRGISFRVEPLTAKDLKANREISDSLFGCSMVVYGLMKTPHKPAERFTFKSNVRNENGIMLGDCEVMESQPKTAYVMCFDPEDWFPDTTATFSDSTGIFRTAFVEHLMQASFGQVKGGRDRDNDGKADGDFWR
jgi:hypothetical protein